MLILLEQILANNGHPMAPVASFDYLLGYKLCKLRASERAGRVDIVLGFLGAALETMRKFGAWQMATAFWGLQIHATKHTRASTCQRVSEN